MTDTPATRLSATLQDAAARALHPAVLREGGRVRAAEVGAEDEPALRQPVDLGLLVPQLQDAAYRAWASGRWPVRSPGCGSRTTRRRCSGRAGG
ncbi:hypothetical protein ACFU7Y_12195 [Kitasatospora sp. NPDC057542]|uniref:hypothetical protein n=1 Tax=Streptomycetaceae TaxID=2062 RepID=UPI001CCD9373|nr:hypothetical protein [Streptomyces sp. LS1784]